MGDATGVRGAALAIRQIERTSAAEEVREQLLRLIQGGELAVGDRLPSENELARSFGVSRPVVREGLGALRAAGYIESRTGSGTFVAAIHPSRSGMILSGAFSVDDLYEVRANVEIPGAGLAAHRRSAEHVARLLAIVARHATPQGARDWVEDDVGFHSLLAEATGNDLQVSLVRELSRLQHEQNTTMVGLTDLTAPFEEHAAIVKAVERRDAAGARVAMAAHLAAILERARAAGGSHGVPEDVTPQP